MNPASPQPDGRPSKRAGGDVKIIDAHCHLYDEPGYLDQLLRTMDRCGIEKSCLSGIGPLFNCLGDKEVQAAFLSHPDRLIGAVFIRPGIDSPDRIDDANQNGFRMVKVSLPLESYHDRSYFPLWERCEKHRMPVLFHTGIVTPRREAPEEMISSWNMHPMSIEPITRAFPDLKIIVAHLGIHWNTDAAELARMRPNVYVDLTGEPGGWRVRGDAVGMDKWLWWPNAFDKVVFGTDVHYSKIERILREDRWRLDRLGIGNETRRKIFAGNILELLGEG
jgi:uncharacterized protein